MAMLYIKIVKKERHNYLMKVTDDSVDNWFVPRERSIRCL